jgi:hypothetical protein
LSAVAANVYDCRCMRALLLNVTEILASWSFTCLIIGLLLCCLLGKYAK